MWELFRRAENNVSTIEVICQNFKGDKKSVQLCALLIETIDAFDKNKIVNKEEASYALLLMFYKLLTAETISIELDLSKSFINTFFEYYKKNPNQSIEISGKLNFEKKQIFVLSNIKDSLDKLQNKVQNSLKNTQVNLLVSLLSIFNTLDLSSKEIKSLVSIPHIYPLMDRIDYRVGVALAITELLRKKIFTDSGITNKKDYSVLALSLKPLLEYLIEGMRPNAKETQEIYGWIFFHNLQAVKEYEIDSLINPESYKDLNLKALAEQCGFDTTSENKNIVQFYTDNKKIASGNLRDLREISAKISVQNLSGPEYFYLYQFMYSLSMVTLGKKTAKDVQNSKILQNVYDYVFDLKRDNNSFYPIIIKLDHARGKLQKDNNDKFILLLQLIKIILPEDHPVQSCDKLSVNISFTSDIKYACFPKYFIENKKDETDFPAGRECSFFSQSIQFIKINEYLALNKSNALVITDQLQEFVHLVKPWAILEINDAIANKNGLGNIVENGYKEEFPFGAGNSHFGVQSAVTKKGIQLTIREYAAGNNKKQEFD